MKLLRDDQYFYLAYKETMKEMGDHYRKHKGRGHFPKLLSIAINFAQWVTLLIACYLLFMLLQIFIMNPIVFLGSLYTEYKLYLTLEKKIKNYRIHYTSNQFQKLVNR